MRNSVIWLTILTLLALNLSVFATPVIFDLRGNAGRVSELNFNVGDLELTVEPGFVGTPLRPGQTGPFLRQNRQGIGVQNSTESGPNPGDNIRHIDGKGPRNDFVELSFDKTVRILNVDFEYVGSGDDSAFVNGDVELGFGPIINAFNIPDANAFDPNPNDNNRDLRRVDFAALSFAGTMFRFGEGLNNSIGNNDRFRVARVEVEHASIPEPSVYVLLACGFVALAGGSKFRKGREE